MDSLTQASPFKYALSRKYLFDVWSRKEKCTVAEKTRHMIEVLSHTLPHLNVEHSYFRKRIADLCMSFSNYYKVYGRSKEKVLARLHKWLKIMERFELTTLKGADAAANSSFESTRLPRIIVPKILKDNGKKTTKTHIKKPLNAFMLYIMEMRHAIPEHQAKNVPASTVNQILGKRWHLLSEQEKAKYYELARHEQLRHRLLYPNYKPKNDPQRRRRKRRKDNPDDMYLGKCRARYGLEHKSLWCRPCIRKKKCIRYKEMSDENLLPTAPPLNPRAETKAAIATITASIFSTNPAVVLTTKPAGLTTDPSPVLTTDPASVLTTKPIAITASASPEPPHIKIKQETDSDDEGRRLNVSALIDFEKDDYFTFSEGDEK